MGAGFWLRTGAIWGCLTVVIGAFGAHGLQARFESLGQIPGGLTAERLHANYQTGVLYQIFCTMAILAVGFLAQAGRGGVILDAAGWMFVAGSLLFSGSLYVMGATGAKWLGAITPLGGVLMIAAWVALAVAAGGSSRLPVEGPVP